MLGIQSTERARNTYGQIAVVNNRFNYYLSHTKINLMMKKILSFLLVMLVFAGSVAAAVTLRYYNKDSKSYTFKVKIAGSSTTVVFDASKTSSVTIQGGSEEAVISCECGDVKVKQGDQIEIKNGCITVK